MTTLEDDFLDDLDDLSEAVKNILASPPPLPATALLPTTKYLPLITEEIAGHHNNLIDVYKRRFPGLEEVIYDPITYARVVEVVGVEGGESLSERVQGEKEKLSKLVKGANMMTLSVSSSMSPGKDLVSSEKTSALHNMASILTLDSNLQTLMSYLSSLTATLCPNMSSLCGPSVSAKLISLAGGLPSLTRIPACNLTVFGAPKTSISSGTGAVKKHNNGIVKECDLVEGAPEYLRGKIIKVLCNKISLAARCDLAGGQSGGVTGEKFKAEIKEKIDKWDSPDKSQHKKALPKPQMESKKKRGGRKVRAAKERFKEGDIHKLANKRAFSLKNGEYGDDAMGMDLGMLGDQRMGTGVGVNLKGNKKAKLSQSKMAQKRRGTQSSSSGGGGGGNGFSTSVVFNHTHGLELADPEQAEKQRKIQEANKKWFSNDLSGFESALPKKR